MDVHDVGGDDEVLWAVNTLYSCVCTVDERRGVTPVWKPSFVSELEPEDRCHLNGLAVVDEEPRFATALAISDEEEPFDRRR